MEDTELSDRYWRRWYICGLWAAAIPVTFLVVLFYAILSSLSTIQLPQTFSDILFGLYLFVSLFMFLAAWWMLFGYYYDAKELKNIDANWRPIWGLWVVAHILISPFLLAPIYLIRRTQKTGVPWKNGYRLRGD